MTSHAQNTMTVEEYDNAWQQFLREGNNPPHVGNTPGRRGGGASDVDVYSTRARWDAYIWNPPEELWPGYLRGPEDPPEWAMIDPKASPKPTYDELKALARRWHLTNEYVEAVIWFRNGHDNAVRQRLTDRTLPIEGKTLYVGDGLDHMAGLIYLAEAANLAGHAIPPIVLRDGDHNTVHRWLQSDIRSMLKQLVDRENRVESSHNIIIGEYHRQAAIRDDATATLDAREAAAAKCKAFRDGYADMLAACLLYTSPSPRDS